MPGKPRKLSRAQLLYLIEIVRDLPLSSAQLVCDPRTAELRSKSGLSSKDTKHFNALEIAKLERAMLLARLRQELNPSKAFKPPRPYEAGDCSGNKPRIRLKKRPSV
jgi:hypothetical protein